MSKSKKQLKKDLKYLKKHLDDNKEINQIIEHTKKIGISSAQYFCEEFVFIPDGETPEECARFHDVEYLDITEFNYHHWIGCLLYTSPSPRDMRRSRMPSSA